MSQEPAPRRSRRRRWLLRSALTGLLVLVLVYVFRGSIAKSVARRLARDAGYALEVEQVSGSFFTSLAVSGLEVHAETPTAPLRELRAESIRVEFSLPALVRGDLAGLKRVLARSLEVEVDATRSAPPSEEASQPGTFEIPSALPHVELEATRIDVMLAAGEELHLTRLLVSSGRRDGFEHVALSGVARLDSAALGARETDLELEGRVGPRELHVDRARVGGLELTAGRFGLEDERFELEAKVGEGTLAGSGGLSPLEVDASLTQVELAELLGLGADGSPARGLVDLELRVRDEDGPALSVQLASLRAASGFGIELDQVRGELGWARDLLTIPTLTAAARGSELVVTDLTLPTAGPPERWVRAARGALALRSTDLPTLTGTELTSGPPPEHELVIELALDAGRAELSEGRLTRGPSEVSITRGVVDLTAAEGWDEVALDLALDVRVAELAEFTELVGAAGWAGGVNGSTTISGAWPDWSGSGSLNAPALKSPFATLGDTTVEFDVGDGRLRVTRLRADGPALTLDGEGTVTLATGELDGVRLDLASPDLNELLPDHARSGELEAHLEVAGTTSAPELRATATGTRLEAFGFTLAELRAELVHATGETRFDELEARTAAGELSVRGSLQTAGDRLELRLDELSARQSGSELALTAPAELVLAGPRVHSSSAIELAGTAGRLRVGPKAADEECLPYSIDELDTRGLLSQFYEAAPEVLGLQGNGVFCQPEDGPLALEGDLAVRSIRVRQSEREYALQGSVQARDGRVRVEGLRVSVGERELLTLEAELPFASLDDSEELRLVLDAAIDELADHVPARWLGLRGRGAVTVNARLEGTVGAPLGSVTADIAELRLGEDDTPLSLGLTGKLDGDRLRLERLRLAGPDGANVTLSGAVSGLGPVPAAFVPAATEELALDLAGEFEVPDLARWLPLVEELAGFTSPLREGRLAGDLGLSGSLAQPEPRATLQLSDGAGRIRGLPPFLAIAAEARLEPDLVLHLDRCAVELGAEALELTGSVDLAKDDPEVELAARGENVLLVRNRDAKLRADVDVKVAGPVSRLEVVGDLALRQGRLVKPLELLDFELRDQGPERREGLQLFRLTEPPLDAMQFDLRVTAAEAFEIDNNVAKGSLRPDLRLTGTGEVPILLGNLYVDRTRVDLPASKITVRSGTITFEEADPFRPRLSLQGEARILGYDVDVLVLGTSSDPEIVLSSVPPLPSEDLVLLVLTGQPPGTSGQKTGRAAAQSVAVYLAKDFLARWLAGSDPESEESLLERFELYTGRDLSRSGAETIEASFRFDEDRFRENDALYLTAESDQYDFINFGVRLVFRYR